jgi:hypothetical protein
MQIEDLIDEKKRLKKHKKPVNKDNFRPILFIFALILAFSAAIFYAAFETKSDEEYLAELSARLQEGEYLASGEMKDYCRLTYELRNEISPECVCILDGINWDNPPESPDFLSEDWEFIEDDPNKFRKRFRHKQYRKIVIGFDVNDCRGENRPHWHRENSDNNFKDFPYLDKKGNPVRRGSPNSHIYTKKNNDKY